MSSATITRTTELCYTLWAIASCTIHAEAKRLAYDKNKKNAGALLKVVSLDSTTSTKPVNLPVGALKDWLIKRTDSREQISIRGVKKKRS